MHKVQHIGRKGSAITLVLLAVVILFVAGTGLLSIGFQSQILSIRMTSDIAARLAADAGLTEAVYEMNEHLKIKPWDDSSLPYAINSALPNSEAVYSYKVAPESTSLYRIESMGDYGGRTRTVRC